MPAIKLTAFIGEQPRIIASMLPDTAATAAVNVRLDDGGLTPIHAPVQVATASDDEQISLIRHEGAFLTWPTVVNAATGPVATDRLYYTGDGPPSLLVSGDVYDLAVPRPATALTATLVGAGSGDVVTRIYVYTYVTDFGEESEPCPVSNEVSWQPGYTVELSDFEDPIPTGRAISLQRIYRSQTSQSGTQFYLIAERAAGTGNFTDNIPVDGFQEPLPSLDWNEPPDDLEGLVAMPNGMMAAFVDNNLYFCEPYRPHAWPEKYILTTDAAIMGLGAIGGSLVVMTMGNPYFVTGSHPSSMRMDKMVSNYPCVNKRSIVDLGSRIAYATHEGLVAVDAGGGIALVTTYLFNRDTWQELGPETFISSQIGGRYVAFYSTEDESAAVVIDISNAPFLIRLGRQAQAAYYEVSTGALFYIESGTAEIKEVDSPTAAREVLYWRSKEFVLPYPDNFGAILIDAESRLSGSETAAIDALIASIIAANQGLIDTGSIEGEIAGAVLGAYALGGDGLTPIPEAQGILSVGVYAAGVQIATIGRTGVPVRLPSKKLARYWQIDVAGDMQVERIILAKTMDELKTVANA